jgi:hypothetical protein
VDDSASRKFNEARKQRPVDPRPVTIEQAAKRKPRKKQVRLTDDQVRTANKEYWSGDETFAEICHRYNTSDSALRNRWKKLGLRTPGRGANLLRRRPQTAVVPVAPKQPETAVTVPAGADPRRATIGYNILRGLLLLLPEDARWTASDRGKHLTAYTAVLDLVTEVKEK